MKLRLEKIRSALGSTMNWARMKRAAQDLTDAELAEAERIERMTQRRENTLKILRSERYRRNGLPDKMLRLKVETRI